MKRFFLLFLAAVLALSLVGCAGGPSEEEARAIFAELIEAAEPLNEIYYGEGLPHLSLEEVYAEFVDDQGFIHEKYTYLPVTEDAPYRSEAEIRAATEAVFTEEMCDYLFAVGFTGLTEDDTLVSYARYITEDGRLTVRPDLAESAIALGRVYDLSSMHVLESKADLIRATFSTSLDGTSIEVRLTVRRTADGWRLDSPTY